MVDRRLGSRTTDSHDQTAPGCVFGAPGAAFFLGSRVTEADRLNFLRIQLQTLCRVRDRAAVDSFSGRAGGLFKVIANRLSNRVSRIYNVGLSGYAKPLVVLSVDSGDSLCSIQLP